MSKCPKFAFIFFLLSIPLHVFSQEIITDRPDQTESAVVVAKGVFQLETGVSLDISESERNWIFNTSLFRYGITKNLEIRLVTELLQNRGNLGESDAELGIGDLQFGLKYQFLDGVVQGAYLGHVVLPTGTGQLSEGETGMSHRIAFGYPLADWLAVSCNLGIEHFHGETADGLYSLSFGFPLTERIGFFTEIYGSWTGFERLEALYDHGLTYLVLPNLQFDFSMGTGLTTRSGFYAIGLSWYAPFQD